MDLGLAVDRVGKQTPVAVPDSDAGLVTGGLDTEYAQGSGSVGMRDRSV
jgi:hypothetical protein